MTLKSDAKFKQKPACSFIYDIRNLANFHLTLKSLKISLRWSLFVQSIKVSGKKIKRSYLLWHWMVIQNLNRPWPCGFKTGMRNSVNFHQSTQKIWKFLIWWTLFDRSVMLQLENFRGIKCHDTESWCKIQVKTWFEKWLGIWLIFMQVVESLKIST